MGIVIRQSFLTSLVSYTGVAIGAFNTLWLFPKFMETGEIGMFRVILNMSLLLLPFAHMGLSQSIIKFYPGSAGSLRSRNQFFSGILGMAVITFCTFFILFMIFDQPLRTF